MSAPSTRTRLWVGPWRLTGPQVRAAARAGLSPAVRVLLAVVLVTVCGVGGGLAGSTGRPELAVVVFLVAFGGYVGVLRWALTRGRRGWGMVRVTADQFDLLIALGQVPAERLDAARQAHDQLVWLLQQPTPDPAALEQCRAWGWHLVSAPG